MDKLGTSILSIVQRGCPFFGGRNVWATFMLGTNSLSIVGRLSTLWDSTVFYIPTEKEGALTKPLL